MPAGHALARVVDRIEYADSVLHCYGPRHLSDVSRCSRDGDLYDATFGHNRDSRVAALETAAGPLPHVESPGYWDELLAWQIRLWDSGRWPRCRGCRRLLTLSHPRLYCDDACALRADPRWQRIRRVKVRSAKCEV